MTSTIVHTYDAGRARRGLRHWLVPMLGYPGLVWRHRGLVANFARRDLVGRFRGSALGALWVLIHPIFLFLIFYFVFGYLFGSAKFGVSGPDRQFAVFLFSGILGWTAFHEGTSRCCSVVVDNGNLVKKVAFPSELLVLHPVLVALAVYHVGIVVLLAIGTALGVVSPTPLLAAWPLVVLVHTMITTGLGLALACVNVFARDVGQLYGVFGQAWFFLSPVFYGPIWLGEKAADLPGLVTVLELNPLFSLLQAERLALGVSTYSRMQFVESLEPEGAAEFWSYLGVAALWGVGLLTLGYTLFMSRRHKFADLV